MSGIGGPGGIGGPKGPGGVDGVGGPDGIDQLDEASAADKADGATAITAAGRADPLDALVADLTAGKITPEQLVDKLIEDQADVEGLSAEEKAELAGMMRDLVENDPHLQGLIGGLR